MATDHNIRQVVINKLTDEQYEQAVKSADELYLTPDTSGGTVTSVRVQATSPVVSSQSTAQTTTLNTTISLANNYGDTKNPYASKTKNYVLAAPVSANGTPSFRALDKADIPLASETAASGGTTTSLVTTGEKYTWNNKQDALPSQSGQSGKFLTTDGSSMSWADASVEIDNSTITKNTNNEVQTVGVKDLRTDNTIKTWTGTKDQYDALSSSSSWSTATQNNNLHYSQDTDWRSIAYGDNKFVALSATGYISTSTDGSNWTTAIQVSNLSDIIGVGNYWSFLFYDNTKFIALGENGNISTSTDGITWTTATIVSNLGSHSWKSIAYNGSMYVALGYAGYISTSTNGTTWTAATQISNLGNYRWYGIAYDGTKFLAVSDYAYVSTSTDGTTWTAATRNSGLNEMMGPIDMIFDGNKFCILGRYGDTITSVDGTNWSEVDYSALDNNRNWYSVAFDGSKYVAIDMDSYISIKDTGINSNTLYNIKDYGLYLGSTEVANVSSGDSLPDQTGQTGKFLTTDGTDASWANVPAGTVTSVRVQAGTGLSSSQSTAQSSTLNTTISIASGYKLPTTTEWGNKQDKLTTQTAYTSKGSATKVPQITTNSLGQVTGITEVTITHPTEIPSQSGNSGKYLTTNGSTLSWASVDALPSQSGQSGKFLTTNGTSASWSESMTWTYNSSTENLTID